MKPMHFHFLTSLKVNIWSRTLSQSIWPSSSSEILILQSWFWHQCYPIWDSAMLLHLNFSTTSSSPQHEVLIRAGETNSQKKEDHKTYDTYSNLKHDFIAKHLARLFFWNISFASMLLASMLRNFGLSDAGPSQVFLHLEQPSARSADQGRCDQITEEKRY